MLDLALCHTLGKKRETHLFCAENSPGMKARKIKFRRWTLCSTGSTALSPYDCFRVEGVCAGNSSGRSRSSSSVSFSCVAIKLHSAKPLNA